MAHADDQIRTVVLPLTLEETLAFRLSGRLSELRQIIQDHYESELAKTILALLYDFGFFAPLSDYHPPLGAVQTRNRYYFVVRPGELRKVCLPICSVPELMRKFKTIKVTPEDVAAEDFVTMAQNIRGPQFAVGFLATAACQKCIGDFSTYENIYIPCKDGYVEFEFENTGLNDARLSIEAVSWLG